MRARPVPRNWVSGELAPWLDGIPGEVTNHGALTMENFVVKKQGAIQRRPGSFYVSEVKNTLSQTILIQCEIDSDNIYVLEMGNLYCRFYKNHTQVSLAAAAYEVTTPYSTGDLTDLRWCYIPNEKALYFAHKNYAVRKLAWTSDASWEMDTVKIRTGPPYIFTGASTYLARSYDLQSYEILKEPYFSTNGYELFDIAYGRGVVVAVGYALVGEGNLIVASNDYGETWTNTTAAPGALSTTNYIHIVYGGNKWIIGSSNSPSSTIWVSRDGIVFDSLTTANLPSNNGVLAYDESVRHWKIVGDGQYSDSSDAAIWASRRTVTLSGMMRGLASDQADRWVSVGSNGSATSGAIWTSLSSTAAFTTLTTYSLWYFTSVAHGKPTSVGLWVSVGKMAGTTSGIIMTSPTGTVWTSRNPPTGSVYLKSIDWIGNEYISSDDNGALIRSIDGISWTIDTPSELSGHVVSIAYEYDARFNESGEYPRYISYHQGRLMLAGSETKKATIWGSETNRLTGFYIGEYGDDAFSYDLASDRNVDIRWIMGGNELAIGTRTAEGVLAGSSDEGITPSSAHMQWQSSFGSDNIQPVRIHDTIIFTQRGGEIVRGYVPAAGSDAWKSPDLTAFADHIARGGITEIDHQDDPQTVAHFVRADGYGLGLTFEGTTRAWWRTKMGATAAGFGTIESLCVIPTSGAEDEIWAVVKWTVGASVRRFIVYFDAYNFGTKEAAHFVDCGYENAACASATVYASVLPQLAGESVDALINGNRVEHGLVVGAGGTLTIAATDCTHLHAGLPYTSYAQTMRIDQNSGWGSGLGLSKRLGNLNVWVHQTIGGKFGPTSSITEAVAYSSTTELTTDCLSVNFPGQWDRDGYIWCIQDDPLPMTVVAVAPDMEMGDR